MIENVQMNSIYVSRINRVVHDLNPTLEGCYLKQAQICFAHVIEIHRWILPRVVLSLADIPIGNDLLTKCRSIRIDALENSQKANQTVL